MAPTLTLFAEDLLCTAGPFARHGAVRREFPASPPRGGDASFGAALQEARS